MGSTRLDELGFADFTTMLITETLDAIISSQLQQEEKILELNRAAQMPLEEFSKEYISDEEVRAEVLRLFPQPDPQGVKSAVDEGMAYIPSGDGKQESPRIKELCSYEMEQEDYSKTRVGFVITKTGYINIMEAVRRRISSLKQEGLRFIASRGIPRVLVDNGKVSAKLTMRIEEQKAEKLKNEASLKSYKNPIGSKLVVRPINARGPEFLTVKTDITSEVEINFKTIVL